MTRRYPRDWWGDMSESNIENEPGYQDAGEIGPDNSVFYAWWAWAAAVVFVVVLSLSCVRALP